jgi:hypothetical protein
MEKTRAFIGEIKEPVKGQTEHLQLVYYEKDRPNAGQIKLWWGEPTKDHPVTQSIFDGGHRPVPEAQGSCQAIRPLPDIPLEVCLVLYLPMAWGTVWFVIYHSILRAHAPPWRDDAPRNPGPD